MFGWIRRDIHRKIVGYSCCRWLHCSWRDARVAVVAAAGRAHSDMTPPRPAASRTRARDARTMRISLVTFANRTGARSPVALILGTSSHLRFVSSARSDRSLLRDFRPSDIRTLTRALDLSAAKVLALPIVQVNDSKWIKDSSIEIWNSRRRVILKSFSFIFFLRRTIYLSFLSTKLSLWI